MDSKRKHAVLGQLALSHLRAQTFIPGQLLEERRGETALCAGAAILFEAHRRAGYTECMSSYFADRASLGDRAFVKRECACLSLDYDFVWNLIVDTKGVEEGQRMLAVPDILAEKLEQL